MWAEFAPAKINLTLELTGKRADGYHTLQSLIVFAACGDSISAEPSDASLLSINGAFGHHLQGNAEDNLIMKALRAVEKICKKPLNVAVKLEKNLPVASGIGGGSADAAAMLRILRKILGKQVKDSDWQEVALALGADVPVCLESKSAFVSGIGEILHPVKQVPAYGIVLVNPMKALATKEVFGVLNGSFVAPEAAPPNMTQTAFRKYISARSNMLEAAATSKLPEIAGLISTICKTPNCILSRMSGSGATCFGLYETKGQAEIAANILSKSFPTHWVSSAQLLT